jgi:uncharacterized protein (DUF433 family)
VRSDARLAEFLRPRFPVSRLLGLLAGRQTPDQILRAYPYLEAADIDEALTYAASLAEG